MSRTYSMLKLPISDAYVPCTVTSQDRQTDRQTFHLTLLPEARLAPDGQTDRQPFHFSKPMLALVVTTFDML